MLNNPSLFLFVFRASVLIVLTACGQKELASFESPAELSSLEEAKTQALSWMNDAQSSDLLTDSERQIAAQVKDLLLNNSILPSPAVFAEECVAKDDKFVAAFVAHEQSDSIFVCDQALNYGPEFLAQVFVHESIHLAGVLDECKTTELERKMIAAGGGQPFNNSYVSECGLDVVE